MKISFRFFLCLALLVLLIIAGCTLMQRKMINGDIVFLSDQDGHFDLFIMNQDGSDQRKLPIINSSVHAISDVSPSPDGRLIAFTTIEKNISKIYIFDLAGGVQKELMKSTSNDYSPTWSPDGKYIAFVSDRDHVLLDENRDVWTNDIYIIKTDGSNIRRVTQDNVTSQYSGLSWSPDGRKLAYNFSSLSKYGVLFPEGIGILTLSDSSLTRLTGNEIDGDPKWSPDGKNIVYALYQSKKTCIYRINANGTDQIALTKDSAYYDTDPFWSPDGKFIVFSSMRDGNYNLYRMNADGSDQIRLTNESGEESFPVWLPMP
jgi:TolB protein